jgi:hypothetical protein
MTWIKQEAETEFIWAFGNVYPAAVICTAYEENEDGEKRLVEQKTFNLVEDTPDMTVSSKFNIKKGELLTLDMTGTGGEKHTMKVTDTNTVGETTSLKLEKP